MQQNNVPSKKILLVTAFFPPDTSLASLYAKELARQLSFQNDVSVLTYGYLPESVKDVEVVTINKQSNRLSRIFNFYRKLAFLKKSHDLIILLNAPSVELPFLLTGGGKNIVYIIADPAAQKRQSWWKKKLSTKVRLGVPKEITLPEGAIFIKPEKLPFTESAEKTSTHESWWNNHLREILV